MDTNADAGLEAVLAFLHERRGLRVALACHQRPDGDAIGSCIALADGLTRAGTPARVVNAGTLPAHLLFLTRSNGLSVDDDRPDWYRDYDCLGVLDCGEAGRLNPPNVPALSRLPTFTIDHHATGDGLGAARWIRPDASSVGEMVHALFGRAGWEMSPLAATGVWTAIVTDTGRFSYENTSAGCLEAALDCIRHGADPAAVAEELYQSVTWEERQLQRLVLDKMRLFEGGKVAVSCLTKEEFRQANSGVEGAQNLINLLRDTAGVDIALFLYEPPTADPAGTPVKASLRTRAPYSALAIACQFGGGGHERAAGCSLPGTVDGAVETMLAAVRREWFMTIDN